MPAADHPKTALIIGASRGLGLAVAEEYLTRSWHVIGTVRGSERTKLHELKDRNGNLEIESVDINVPDELTALHTRLQGRTLDFILVNAGVTNAEQDTAANVTTDEFTRVMVTNALSPLRTIEVMRDLVRPDGTIAIMSSRQGSVASNERGGFDVYRASKAAVNTLMRSYAARHATDSRTLLLLAPGWVRTELGGSNAPLSIEESIPNLINTIEAQHGTPGLRYLDYLGRTIPW